METDHRTVRLRTIFDWLKIVRWAAREQDFLVVQIDRIPRVPSSADKEAMAAARQWEHHQSRVDRYLGRIADALGCANGAVYSSRFDNSYDELLYTRSD